MKTMNQIVMMIEGFIALCLGSSDRVVWVNQTDAAAFSDGEKIYLPRPAGMEGELELLLGIALREVAKILHSNAGVFTPMQPELLGYATAIEDARIKQEISETYKGAASVFDAATNVMRRINSERTGDGQPDSEVAKHLAIWAAANDAYLGTPCSKAAASEFAEVAASCVDPKKLAIATGMAQAAPWLKSADATAACAVRIQTLLAEPEPEQQQQQQQQQQPEPGQDKDQDRKQSQKSADQGAQDESQQDPQSQSTPQGENGEAKTGDEVGDGQPEQPHDPNAQAEQGQPDESQQDPQSQSTPQGEVGDKTPDDGKTGDGQAGSSHDSDSPDGQENESKSSNQPGAKEQDEGQGTGQPSPASSSASQQQAGGTQDADAHPDVDQDQNGKASTGSDAQGQTVESSGFSSDPMSNALARLKGHKGAMPGRMPTPSEQQGEAQPVDGSLVSALLSALQQPDAMEQLEIIALELVQEAPATAAEDLDVELGALELLCQSTLASGGHDSNETMEGSNTLGPVPGRLVSVLLREFQDKRPKSQHRSQSGRDLSVQHLWRLKAVGDTRVFRKKSPSVGIDAAVWLLLDRSTSMEDDIELAASATNAFAQALQRISGVQTAMSLFPGDDHVVQDVLKFRQSTVHAAAKLRSVTADGLTPTAGAIQEILPRLLRTPVQKRVIVLITDGHPNAPILHTHQAIALANAQGVDVIGIGIGPDADIENIIARSVSIMNIADLPSALEALFKKELSTSLLAA